ncbi:MAG: glycosyl hydrolase family 8 [Salipiger thiooxidans]|jgi:endoglucanase|uniref:glycosyl hydrolase family 8 n=1 Tax=Salipiger thiooxidans TaxID=282683 RepID=UPI001CFBF7F9|nr:glycosyl hydrolase family 8 [Salipiger thiooxidans]
MKRRAILAGLGTLAGLSMATAPGAWALGQIDPVQLKSVWTAWRNANLDVTGRVVDQLQRNASHSEGQGYGMLLAALAGDARAFAEMENWSRINLAIRPDNLMAWRWMADQPERVPDINNASDGDLFRAWALLKGAERFGNADYRTRAGQITRDLVANCVTAHPGTGQPLLLPAVHGFQTPQGLIYNPSYAMPLAMTELAEAFSEPDLSAAASSGLAVAEQLAYGGVVPDWVEITASGVRSAQGFSFDAGYEAMRVPLFLVWSGHGGHLAVTRYAEAQRGAPRGEVATIISRDDGSIQTTSRNAGYAAVAALADCATQATVGSGIPPYVPSDPYYPATLHLFAMIAQMEAEPRCLPI